jgi:hypothetical protein
MFWFGEFSAGGQLISLGEGRQVDTVQLSPREVRNIEVIRQKTWRNASVRDRLVDASASIVFHGPFGDGVGANVCVKPSHALQREALDPAPANLGGEQ